MDQAETVTAAVGRILGAGFPGVEIVDRDLVFGRQSRVPYVLVDGDGRLVLALALDTTGDEAALTVLDALSFARAQASALARHLGSTRLRAELNPAVWIVARELDAALRARLAALDPRGLRAFELVRIESRRGVGEYLTELPLFGDLALRPAVSPLGFLDTLTPDLRELGESIVRRVERLDDDLETSRSQDALAWRFHAETVCSLSAGQGGMAGNVPDSKFDSGIASREDAERFLDAAVQRYLGLLGQGELFDATRSPLREPLLTPEELAAFDPAV